MFSRPAGKSGVSKRVMQGSVVDTVATSVGVWNASGDLPCHISIRFGCWDCMSIIIGKVETRLNDFRRGEALEPGLSSLQEDS